MEFYKHMHSGFLFLKLKVKMISLFKPLLLTFCLIQATISCFSQITIGKVEEDVKPKIVAKPPPYDSLSDFQYYDYKLAGEDINMVGGEHYNKYIGLNIFFPPYPDNDVNKKLSNKYYTILDIRYGNKLRGYCNIEHLLFILKEDSSGNTVYYEYTPPSHEPYKPFVLVAYFTKMKELYVGQRLTCIKDLYRGIDIGSRWICKDVTLLNDNDVNHIKKDNKFAYGYNDYYSLYFILQNDRGEKRFITPKGTYNSSIAAAFKLESIYLEEEQQRNIQQDQIAAKQKQLDQEKDEKEQSDRVKYKAECISKYGTVNGSLIADEKVSIGMTIDMCRQSWGIPYDSNKITKEKSIVETWYYGWHHILHFTNGVLTEIEE